VLLQVEVLKVRAKASSGVVKPLADRSRANTEKMREFLVGPSSDVAQLEQAAVIVSSRGKSQSDERDDLSTLDVVRGVGARDGWRRHAVEREFVSRGAKAVGILANDEPQPGGKRFRCTQARKCGDGGGVALLDDVVDTFTVDESASHRPRERIEASQQLALRNYVTGTSGFDERSPVRWLLHTHQSPRHVPCVTDQHQVFAKAL